MKNSPNIFNRLKRSRNLPALPQVLLKLIEACNDENCTPKRLSQITFKDPSISTKVLQLVNSAHAGLHKKVTTLEKAVVYLGADSVKNIAISSSVLHVFSKARGNGTFSLSRFWWHSLLCASLARALAEETGYPAPEEAFLAGLLHDIGKLVLWTNFRKEYKAVLEEAENDPVRLLAGETNLGAPHHEVGAWLVNQWKLNSFMADAIYYHHSAPEEVAGALPLVKITYAANLLSRGAERLSENAAAEAQNLMGIETPRQLELIWKAQAEIEEVARSFGITVSSPDDGQAPTPESDRATRESLASEIKNFSLVYGTLQSLLGATSKSAILEASQKGLSILLNVRNSFHFLYDEGKGALVGQAVPGTDSALIDRVDIPVKNGNSMFARTLKSGIPENSFTTGDGQRASIAEEQICRQLGTEGMMCLPMRVKGDPVGVIVMGVHEQHAAALAKQQKLLDLFINHVGMCLHADKIKQDQARIIQEERLKASSKISRMVVHEVNNPLGIIKNYLKILSLKLPEKHPAQTELSIIGEEILRVGQIIRQLNDFSQSRMTLQDTVDVNTLLSNVLKLLKDSLFRPTMIEAKFTPDQTAPNIISDKNGLKQVIINLIKNAVEAMASGGHLHIATKFMPDARSQPTGATKTQPGALEITVKDDGPGMPEDIRKRLFEPFVTSKTQGRGLGLSIVHGIIRELNGTITCESSIDVGTTFTINLPTIPVGKGIRAEASDGAR